MALKLLQEFLKFIQFKVVKKERSLGKPTQSSDTNSGLSSDSTKLVLCLADVQSFIIQPHTCSQTHSETALSPSLETHYALYI